MKRIWSVAAVAMISISASTAWAASVGSAANKVEEKTKEMINDARDKSDVAAHFDRGSAVLSDGAKTSIKALVQSLDADQRSGKVMVVAWSDKNFPAAESQVTTKTDQKLADDRADAVKTYLHELGADRRVTTVNMAQKDNILARVFDIKTSKVKETYKKGVTDSKELADTVKTLKDDGGPGKVVVLFEQDAYQAH